MKELKKYINELINLRIKNPHCVISSIDLEYMLSLIDRDKFLSKKDLKKEIEKLKIRLEHMDARFKEITGKY